MATDEEKNVDPVVEAIGALNQKNQEGDPDEKKEVDLGGIVKKLTDKRQKAEAKK